MASRYCAMVAGSAAKQCARDDLVLPALPALRSGCWPAPPRFLARRYRQGLLAGVPILWPVGFVMLYSPADRWIFVAGVALRWPCTCCLTSRRSCAAGRRRSLTTVQAC